MNYFIKNDGLLTLSVFCIASLLFLFGSCQHKQPAGKEFFPARLTEIEGAVPVAEMKDSFYHSHLDRWKRLETESFVESTERQAVSDLMLPISDTLSAPSGSCWVIDGDSLFYWTLSDKPTNRAKNLRNNDARKASGYAKQ